MLNLGQIKIFEMEDFDEGHRKYILAEVEDAAGNKILVIRHKYFGNLHRSILHNLELEITPLQLKVKCLGGGKFYVLKTGKEILIYGESFDFGAEPDRTITVGIFRAQFPEFQVTLSPFSPE